MRGMSVLNNSLYLCVSRVSRFSINSRFNKRGASLCAALQPEGLWPMLFSIFRLSMWECQCSQPVVLEARVVKKRNSSPDIFSQTDTGEDVGPCKSLEVEPERSVVHSVSLKILNFFSFEIPPICILSTPDAPFFEHLWSSYFSPLRDQDQSTGLKRTPILILSQSTQIHSGTTACDGREIAGPAQQSCLVLVIIAAVRSVSRCLLPNNYPSAVLTGGKRKYALDYLLALVSQLSHSTQNSLLAGFPL